MDRDAMSARARSFAAPFSLYERLGGMESITSIVERMFMNRAADRSARALPAGLDGGELKRQEAKLFARAFGGPALDRPPTAEEMVGAPTMEGPDWQTYLEHLSQAMRATGIESSVIEEATAALLPLANEIAWLESRATPSEGMNPMSDRFSAAPRMTLIPGGNEMPEMLRPSRPAADFDASARATALDKAQIVLEYGADGTILAANQNALELLGYRLDELTGKHHSLFVDPAHAASAAYRSFWADLMAGQPQSGEYQRFGRGNREVWTAATYLPVQDATGKTCRVVECAIDLSWKHQGERDSGARTAQVAERLHALAVSTREMTSLISTLQRKASEERASARRTDIATLENAARATENAGTELAKIQQEVAELMQSAGQSFDQAGAALRTAQVELSDLQATRESNAAMVETLNGLARRQNLLALNVKIAALRRNAPAEVGELANELKALAAATTEATTTVRDHFESLYRTTQHAKSSLEQAAATAREGQELRRDLARDFGRQTSIWDQLSRHLEELRAATTAFSHATTRGAAAASGKGMDLGSAQQRAREIERMASEIEELLQTAANAESNPRRQARAA